MKFLVACILVIIALVLVLNQQGAIDWAMNHINTGAAGATYRGMK